MNIYEQAYERQTDKALRIVARAQETRKKAQRCMKLTRRVVDFCTGGLTSLSIIAFFCKDWQSFFACVSLAIVVALSARAAGIRA